MSFILLHIFRFAVFAGIGALSVVTIYLLIHVHTLEDEEQTLDEEQAETDERLDDIERRLDYLESIDNREK